MSYVLGEEGGDKGIWLDDKSFHSTKNLHDALRGLCLKEHERIVWVDAVCINQSDDLEETAQFEPIRSIYALTERVVIFLADDDSERSEDDANANEMDLVTSLTKCRELPWLEMMKS